MEAAQPHHEEYGAPAWVAIVLAIVLALAVGGPLLHPVTDGLEHTAPVRAAASGTR